MNPRQPDPQSRSDLVSKIRNLLIEGGFWAPSKTQPSVLANLMVDAVQDPVVRRGRFESFDGNHDQDGHDLAAKIGGLFGTPGSSALANQMVVVLRAFERAVIARDAESYDHDHVDAMMDVLVPVVDRLRYQQDHGLLLSVQVEQPVAGWLLAAFRQLRSDEAPL